MHPRERAAIVTGSDSGIGHAVAVALAANGFDIGLIYSDNSARAESLAHDLRQKSVRVLLHRMNPAEPDGSAAAVDELARAFGVLDVLVSCPGGISVEGIHRSVRYMIAGGRGGRIVTIATSLTSPDGLTGPLAGELSQYSITVNSVVIATTDADPAPDDPVTVAEHDEAAAVAAYLATPPAMYVTGAAYVVDGARIAMIPHSLSSADASADAREPVNPVSHLRSDTRGWAPTKWTR